MIAKHPQFIEALEERKKVRVKFYSVADSGVLDLVLAPMDYGPGAEAADGPHRYWLWNALADGPTRILGLAPQQIVDLQVLGETFDPSEFGAGTWPWAIRREWGEPSPGTKAGATPPVIASTNERSPLTIP